MLTSEILTAARALIDTPEKWRGGANAAISEAYWLKGGPHECAYEALRRAIGLRNNLAYWECTHAELMAAFDKATAAERAREAAGG